MRRIGIRTRMGRRRSTERRRLQETDADEEQGARPRDQTTGSHARFTQYL